MKLKRIWRSAGLIILGLVLLCMGINRAYDRPHHIPDPSLIAPASAFPTAWGQGSDAISGIIWEDVRSSNDTNLLDPGFRSSWFSSESWGIGLPWRAQGPTSMPYLYQEASKYPTVVEAILKYHTLNPGDSAAWHGIPFRGAIQTPAIDPNDWVNPSSSASAQRAVCAVGTLDACEMWYAWIRYGQYIYQVILVTPAHGMSAAAFHHLIQDIDAHVGPKY